MPLYSYVCETHGEFDAWRSMSEYAKPAPCPTCRRRARRVVSAPALARLDGATRKAHHINERSADQPRVASTPGAGGVRRAGSHNHGGHGHAHPPSRPWMVGH